MMLVGLGVGVAVWFTVGLVLLIPIAVSLGRKSGASLLLTALPMVAGLSVMHGLVPPHPGPIAAIELVGADPGRTILYSILVAVPVAAVAGPIFAAWISRRLVIAPGSMASQFDQSGSVASPPGLMATVTTVVFPVGLMLGSTALDVVTRALAGTASESGVSAAVAPSGLAEFVLRIRPWVMLVGTPTVAMLLGLGCALFSFGIGRGLDRHQIGKYLDDCLGPVATVLLVVGAGGAFSKVLDVSGVGAAIAGLVQGWQVSMLILGWLLAAVIRVAVGSATVAVTMAAGMMAPVAALDGNPRPELLVLAMGAGSLILSHVNDGGFWFVKEYLGMTVAETLKTWTVIETLIAILGLACVLALDWVV
jgi:GntP family gluconate:H+ symporter